MSFTPSYGEPNWLCRPYAKGGYDYFIAPTDDKSYEENRFLLEDQFRVPPLEELSGCSNTMTHVSQDETFSSPSLLSARQAIFLRWSQSPPVDIIVGREQTSYRMPSEFLTKRSDPFRMILKNGGKEAISHSISLPETAPQTFEHIFIWALSPHPEIDSDLPLLVLVDIAIFATIYLMPALLHQALDILREKWTEPQAALTPELLEHIYSQVNEQSLLRYLTQAALATIGRSWSVDKATDQALASWKQVIERYPTLGYDYFHVQVKGWSSLDLAKGGQCRFHRHLPQQIATIAQTQQTSCVRVGFECFEDVGYIHSAEKASEKSENNGGSVYDPADVKDRRYLEHGVQQRAGSSESSEESSDFGQDIGGEIRIG